MNVTICRSIHPASTERSPAPAALQATMGSRYEIVREVGSGGTSTVYLAIDHERGARVAVKVLDTGSARALERARFRQEIRIVRGLRHPNVLPLLDAWDDADLLCYVMPFVSGESLRERLRGGATFEVRETARVAGDVAAALTHAHARGVVHRDVKPENVLFDGGRAVLSDFGVALSLGLSRTANRSRPGLVAGTPQYMSPEQAFGETDVDTRTDVYALGCLIFEMLAGSPPFTGRTSWTILAKKLWGEVPSLRKVRSDVSAKADEAVRRALAPIPADRLQSVAELGAALGCSRRPRRRVAAHVG